MLDDGVVLGSLTFSVFLIGSAMRNTGKCGPRPALVVLTARFSAAPLTSGLLFPSDGVRFGDGDFFLGDLPLGDFLAGDGLFLLGLLLRPF